jgi:hypothetical protein
MSCPAQDGGLSKGIKYYILCLALARLLGTLLGSVYTMVEKSTGHEKKGVSQLSLVENATLDRWVFTLGEEHNGGELFSWMIK